MPNHRTAFNHVGLCVADRERSRRFYEGLLGFTVLVGPRTARRRHRRTSAAGRADRSRATYLVRDGFVLELIDYSKRDVHAGPQRVMDEVGLTHMSLSVSDLAGVLAQVESSGDRVVEETATEQFAMIRDPDGQLIELLPDTWLADLPPRP